MRTIHKFTHAVAEKIEIEVPRGASLVKIDRDTRQPDDLAFWFEVDTAETETKEVRFRVVGTGQELPVSGFIYEDSIKMGYFIWHIYRG